MKSVAVVVRTELDPVVEDGAVEGGELVALFGKSIGLLRPEKRPQYQPQNWPKVPFEKDTNMNLKFWTFLPLFGLF